MFLVDLTKAFLRGLLAPLSSPIVPQAALDIFPIFYDFFGVNIIIYGVNKNASRITRRLDCNPTPFGSDRG
ncbi:hypothetical protein F383_36185 [Gossypium arboreum]|uniref:Uncharacterized protein n=2 Tax=Gossypium TaxID=3633 RepID=A0A0B0PT42_GOSAR|nr:hypothetical protein F383_36185 [Gossypium arboreum]TYI02473.1 hypothetical protein ES332_A11G269800v1 [Gossypium tomentosum]